MSGLAVATEGLSKTFGGLTVVDQVALRVPAGSVYGFLGPNGSGKTTTIRMLLGLIAPSGGRMELLGQGDPVQALDRMGCLVEGPAFHPYLSGRANLMRLDAADPRADARSARGRVDAALDRVGLGVAARKTFRRYSLGMRQRLGLAAALLRPRDLLILDEPTNGLDPQGTREVRHLISDLARDGASVLVSSHLLSEIEQVCTHLGVISAGRLVAQGTPAEIRGAHPPQVVVTTPDTDRARAVLTELGAGAVTAERDGLRAVAPERPPEQIVARLVAADVAVRGFQLTQPTLEDVFVRLTGEGFDVAH